MDSSMQRILLVDDDEDDVVLVRLFLEEKGPGEFHVDHASTWEQGAERMRDRQHDLYLVDYRLGGARDGLEWLQMAVADGCPAPIIVLTGQGSPEVDRAAMKAGASDYLVKGCFDAEALVRSLRYSLERKKSEAALKADIIERKRAEEEARLHLRRIGLLNDIARAVAGRDDLVSIGRAVLERVVQDLPVDDGAILALDADTRDLEVLARGQMAASLGIMEGSRKPIGEELIPCLDGHVVYVADVTVSRGPVTRLLTEAGIRSLVAAPMTVDNQVMGILIASRCSREGFSAEEREFLRQLGEQVALAVQKTRLHEQLQRAYDHLRETQRTAMEQERLRALGEMASGIAHDINNALTPIVGFTDMLLSRKSGIDDCARHYLECVQAAGADIGHLVARMREFYRGRDDRDLLVPMQLNSVVRETVEMTQPRWCTIPMEAGFVIQLVMELEPHLPRLSGSVAEVREALTNLIFNAVDAMPAGGPLTVRTRGGPGLPHLVLEVSDGGAGMDEDTRRRCLEPFFTTKGDRGTGLGLAMVYGVMHRHGGEVEIDSAPGQGTTVRLVFPVLQSDEAPLDAGQPDTDNTGHPLSVLCIDDDPAVLHMLGALLSREGHDVTMSEGGVAGLAAFHASLSNGTPFDVVLTDLGMPGINGREVVQAIKRERLETTVVLLTGWGTDTRLAGTDAIPPDLVLGKPPRMDDLRRAMAHAQGHRSCAVEAAPIEVPACH